MVLFVLNEKTISTTFHGRDIFAPTASRLARGIPPIQLGHTIDTYVKLDYSRPEIHDNCICPSFQISADTNRRR